MVQVTDLKNSPPMLGKHRAVTRQALSLLQDNYPEFIAKKVHFCLPLSCRFLIRNPKFAIKSNKRIGRFYDFRPNSVRVVDSTVEFI
jgi:hypothetical protein